MYNYKLLKHNIEINFNRIGLRLLVMCTNDYDARNFFPRIDFQISFIDRVKILNALPT